MVIIVGEEKSLLFVKVNSMTLGRITPSAIINIAEGNRGEERGAASSACTPTETYVLFSEVFYTEPLTLHRAFILLSVTNTASSLILDIISNWCAKSHVSCL